jgi:hypothetical protein
MTRFTKTELRRLLVLFDLPVKISTVEGYALHREEVLIYLLKRMTRGALHSTMEDDIHGGQCGRNITGYKWLIWYLDAKKNEPRKKTPEMLARQSCGRIGILELK